DREETELRHDAAVGGEAAYLAAGSEHAMAWHDDRERVSPERLTHGSGRAGRTEPSRDLAVGERRTRRNGARDLVDAAMERGQALHVEPNAGEIARLPAEERDDSVERAPRVGRRRRLAGVRKSP